MKKLCLILLALLASLTFLTACKSSHKHKFSKDYSYNETTHWYNATCEHKDKKSEEAPHTFGEWVQVKAPTEEETGLKERACTICRYKETDTISKSAHTHKFSNSWSFNEKKHWHNDTCGHNQKSNEDTHTFDDGVETNDGTKYSCTICGYYELRPSEYMVTAEEFANILGSVEKYKVEYYEEPSNSTIIIVEDNAVYANMSGWINYDTCEGENYFSYFYDEEEKYWIKEPNAGDNYIWGKSTNNTLLRLKDYFSDFAYDPTTRSYKAEEVILSIGGDAMKVKNISLTFKGEKLLSATFTLENKSYDDAYTDVFYEYSKIGTATVEIPTNVHEHTYSSEWSASSNYHYHATTCVHTLTDKDREPHNFVKGICSVCNFNALMLSQDGKTIIGIADNLPSVTFPAGVTAIGEQAFFYCSELTEIEIPEGITTIGNSAFGYCSKLKKIKMPKSLTTIGNNAFEDCSKLAEIEIPDGVSTIAHSTFINCNELKKVSFSVGLLKIAEYAFSGCSKLSNFTLPSTLTYIGSYAFRGCNGITRVVIPDSVTKVGYGAFNNCTLLTFIKMTGGIQNLNADVFADYTALKTAVISEGTTSLTSNSFYGCTGLTKVVFPKSLKIIYSNVLKNSDKLEAICYNGTPTEWEAINIHKDSADKINATPIYFYSDTYPDVTGNFWHYDENGEVVLWQTHTFSNEWTYDETHHWHATTCEHDDVVKDFAEHTFTESEETEQGTVYVCSCGYSETRASRYRVSEEKFKTIIKGSINFRVTVGSTVNDCNNLKWKVQKSDGTIRYYSSDNVTYYTYYQADGSTEWIKEEITRGEYYSAVNRLNQMPYICELYSEMTYDVNQKCYIGKKVMSGGNELAELLCYFEDGKLTRMEFETQGIRFIYNEFDKVNVSLPENVRA